MNFGEIVHFEQHFLLMFTFFKFKNIYVDFEVTNLLSYELVIIIIEKTSLVCDSKNNLEGERLRTANTDSCVSGKS